MGNVGLAQPVESERGSRGAGAVARGEEHPLWPAGSGNLGESVLVGQDQGPLAEWLVEEAWLRFVLERP